MSDLPRRVTIVEKGPREGFQIEAPSITAAQKIALIDALSATGVREIETVSFVNPARVPSWADAEGVVRGMTPRPGVAYTALWFDERGLNRALAWRDRLTLEGIIALSASEAFSRKNLNRDHAREVEVMRSQTKLHLDSGLPVKTVFIMAAFGCNYSGDIAPAHVIDIIATGMGIAAEAGVTITGLALADTMGWATPVRLRALVAEVRNRWPDPELTLHLHDTRGLGIANAYEALRLGVTRFDAAVAGLGGCPFAGQANVPGNIATEELVLMCDELGIATDIDLEAVLEAGRLAERIVGHPLPSAALRSGGLNALRARAS